MSNNLPGNKGPEELAEDIMNQSDESMDDLLEGTEILTDADADFEDLEDFGDVEFEDDGGDYTDF